MDKKRATLIIMTVLVFCIGLFGIYSLYLTGKLSQKNRNDIPIYIFLGNYVDTTYHRTLPTVCIYTHHLIPEEVKEHGVIPDAETAAKVASILIPVIYGADCFKKESPMQIKSVNNEIWSVKGTLPQNALGGTFCILLDKKTGGMIMVSHGK